MLTLEDVNKARDVLSGIIHETPLDLSKTFSRLTSSTMYLKLENLQKTGSFKIRGAYVKIQSLSSEERAKGVIAASAGNHAQGVAYSASLLKTKAVVVMPEHASPAKIDATKGYGAEMILSGKTFDDALRRAKEISNTEGKILVHAFDDPYVIAGQGTIGLEIMTAQPDIEVIVVPVGGGGLISGIALAVKSINPRARVVGVQSTAFPSAYTAYKTGKLESVEAGSTIADGIAVKRPSELTMNLIKKHVDDVVLVNDDEIAKAMFLLMERAKIVVEPAGASSLAAVLAKRVNVKGKKCAVVLSGGNVDMYTLDHVVTKGLEMEGRLVRLRFLGADTPGMLRKTVDVIANANGNIVDVQHERMGAKVPLGEVNVIISIETQNTAHTKEMLAKLTEAKIKYERLR